MKLEKVIQTYEKLAIENNKEPESIKWLIMELSFYTPSQFYLNLKTEMNESFIQMVDEAARKYIFESIPVQHILGFSYFYGYKFKVNNDVLIPRRETEELVEEVLSIYDEYFEGNEVDVLDLGTGSGCISVTLSLEEPNMNVTASDISEDALKVALANNDELGAKVNFKVSNWFDQIDGKFDIIVANPPYIPDHEAVQDIVEKEPSIALFGGLDGLNPYEIILSCASKYLKDKALIAFEHGYTQSEAIKAIALKYFPNATIRQKKDMQGKDRMTFVGLNGVLK
ncbi:peptide chain release factor N(5)-glutamine methyltransferase [Acholeplasma hippikon]|uniref:peptide chain release factor N(5)-glutamine methyltransferase n=1 Tax=Acholeplasma hippikon TaxID=264636 RepID=A0A449BKG6_9MOLU|nr:peptide chain release factor N(5)-glutamine methyltransferase [Acholeplasma hippikon]VEU82893.1 protoporphyrinogen oxidase [Acholeplasma hippikon]